MKASLDVVFATYSGLPDGDQDDLLALTKLEAKGLNVAVLDWRQVSAGQLDSRIVVLRSTWDYHHYYREFLDWVDVVASRTKLINAADLIHWNSNKKYLLDIERPDLQIVRTIFIEKQVASSITAKLLATTLEQSHIDEASQIVVKPTVGLSTYGVKRFSLVDSKMEDICEHVAALGKSSDVMIQPYLTAVEADGERALVFFNGTFSHAVSKTPFQKMASAGGAGEKSVVAAADEIAFGQNVLQQLKLVRGAEPLYARVDVLRDDGGQLVLMELELIEPSLFLGWEPQAGSRFADAIAAALN